MTLSLPMVGSAQTQHDVGQDKSVVVYEDEAVSGSEQPSFRPSAAKLSVSSNSSSPMPLDDPQSAEGPPRPPRSMATEVEGSKPDYSKAQTDEPLVLQAAPKPPRFPQEVEATFTSNQEPSPSGWDQTSNSIGPAPRVNPGLFQKVEQDTSDQQPIAGSNRPVSLDPAGSTRSLLPLRPKSLTADEPPIVEAPADAAPSMNEFSSRLPRFGGEPPTSSLSNSDSAVQRASFNQDPNRDGGQQGGGNSFGGNSFGGGPAARSFQPPQGGPAAMSPPAMTSPPAQPIRNPIQNQPPIQRPIQRSARGNGAMGNPRSFGNGNPLRNSSSATAPQNSPIRQMDSMTPMQRTAALKKQQRDQLKPALQVASNLLNRFDIEGHNTIPGTPVALVEMMREPISSSSRDAMIHQYWETFYDWAALNVAREHQGWAQSLPTNVSPAEQGLVETAKRIAQDRMLAAEIQMGKSQSRLLDFFANPRSDDFLPMPSDLPTVSPYFETNYDLWKQVGAVSSNFRGIDQMLDGTIRLTAQRAATVSAARRARSEVLAAVSGRQASLATAIQSAELCRSAELDMIASVVSYNQAIGHYMLAVEPTKPAEQLVTSMIGKSWIERMNSQAGQSNSVLPGMSGNSAIASDGRSIMTNPSNPNASPERTARVEDLPLRSDFR